MREKISSAKISTFALLNICLELAAGKGWPMCQEKPKFAVDYGRKWVFCNHVVKVETP